MAFFVGAVIGGIVGVGALGAVWVTFMVATDGKYQGSESYDLSTCEQAIPDEALSDLGFDPDSGSISGMYDRCEFDGGDDGTVTITIHEGTNYSNRTEQNKVRAMSDVLDQCGSPYYAVQREYNPDWLDLPDGVVSCSSMGEDEIRGRAIGVEVQAERSAALTIDIQQPPNAVSGDDWEEPTAAIVAASREAL